MKKKLSSIISAFIYCTILFYVNVASAEETQPSQIDCTNPTNEYEKHKCAISNISNTDAELNYYYKLIKEHLETDPKLEEAFTSAQKAWVNFVKNECLFQESGLGTAAGKIFNQCRHNLIEKRLADFHYYLHCQEGDLTCPLSRVEK